MKQDMYTADGALDMQAIERQARQLRATATRNAVFALIAFFKPKADVAKSTQNA